MEKGNALGSASAVGLGDVPGPALPVESTTTVTSVVTGVGATAAEHMTKAVADKAAEAAIEETRERMQRHRAAETTEATRVTETGADRSELGGGVDRPEPGSDEPRA